MKRTSTPTALLVSALFLATLASFLREITNPVVVSADTTSLTACLRTNGCMVVPMSSWLCRETYIDECCNLECHHLLDPLNGPECDENCINDAYAAFNNCMNVDWNNTNYGCLNRARTMCLSWNSFEKTYEEYVQANGPPTCY